MVNNRLSFVLVILMLAACSSPAPHHPTVTPPTTHQGPDLTGVGGVKPQFEPPSRIGNKDYVVFGQPYKVWNDIEQYSEEGTASWYGPGFHGLYTSNGELYDQESISAAHKNLPLPSYLKVTNLESGKAIVVRVNDRGPFHGDRILDLSHGAATRLGIVGPGTARVRVELIKVPPPRQRRSDHRATRGANHPTDGHQLGTEGRTQGTGIEPAVWATDPRRRRRRSDLPAAVGPPDSSGGGRHATTAPRCRLSAGLFRQLKVPPQKQADPIVIPACPLIT